MTQYVLSLSYGKDSLACLGAIEKLGLPLDRIVHAEVWATDTIPADLPPMVEFKKKADAIIKERWGITVEHICATKPRERERERENLRITRATDAPTRICSIENSPRENSLETLRDSQCKPELGVKSSSTSNKLTYEDIFYRPRKPPKGGSRIYGFPMVKGNWCTSDLKQRALRQSGVSIAPGNSKSMPSLRISDISPSRELVHFPQTASFPTAP